MSTPNELRLRYFIQLASNIGVTARREANEFDRAQDQMTRSTRNTDRAAHTPNRLHATSSCIPEPTSSLPFLVLLLPPRSRVPEGAA